MSVFFWIAGVITGVAVAADLIYHQFAARRIRNIIENVPTFAAIPATAEQAVDTFTITTSDGISLRACLILPPDQPPRGIVAFCPELNGNLWTGSHYAGALPDAGIALLCFEFRNQGECLQDRSYSPIHWVTEFELRDIEAALLWIDSHEEYRHLPKGLFGVSRGGSAALVACCRHPEVSAVITDSGYSTMSLIRNFMFRFSRFVVPDWVFSRLPRWQVEWDIRSALRKSERGRRCSYVHLEQEVDKLPESTSVLLISGSRDSYVTPAVAGEVAQTLGRQDCSRIVQKAKHNKSRTRLPDQYDQWVVTHFMSAFGFEVEDVSDRDQLSRVA